MRTHISCLALLLLLVTGAAAQSTPAPAAPAAVKNPQAQAQLKEITGPDGRFSIMMPGTPEAETSKDPDGTTQTNQYLSSFEDDNVAYMLVCTFFQEAGGVPADKLLQAGKQGLIKDQALTLDSEKPITLGAVQGIAVIAHNAKGLYFDVHLYFGDSRLYQVMVATSAGQTATFRDAFFNSFKIK